MNYELCKKLKDAGFPNVKLPTCSEGHEEDGKHEMFGTCVDTPGEYPTLSELISACGDRLGMLRRESNWWEAIGLKLNERDLENSKGIVLVKGNSPEEAICNLWLKLHEKTD